MCILPSLTISEKNLLFLTRILEMMTMRLSLFLMSALARPEDFLGTVMVRPAGLFPVSSLDIKEVQVQEQEQEQEQEQDN